ncbi:MAG: DUF4860 domain-containing protein [Erysipelotrichaceae bacterium]|nr:DUF4860 domain-containing protein [Erysipelotrichaceae bacterium]MBQ1534985.1 DUF4860 domain-containing protein [Erysipelotrichaceae bacterium]MBQ5804513.1 DUF4860 domain-containing protein [Erysipelotrichaceae bacterium]
MKKKESYSGLFIIGITAFFLGCFMLLIVFGVGVYRNVVEMQNQTNSLRSLSSYLLTVSKVGETGISVEEGAYGKMLVIEDGDTGYGNRIYVYEGELLEDFGKIGGKLYPDAAIRIAETEVFTIEELKNDLLKITTSAGSVYIHMLEERP